MSALPLDSLANLVSVGWMRRHMSLPTALGQEEHPLLLPLHELGDVEVDYTVLQVPLPLAASRAPAGNVGEMLAPLAQLCAKHEGLVPETTFRYLWFYLEVLDRDGDLHPCCWISSRLYQGFLDADEFER